MDGQRKRLEDVVLEGTTDSGTVIEVSMFKTETSSFESAEETLREEDMVGREGKKNSDFEHQGDFSFPHPNFC
jgi:hypothetical protein